MIRIQCGGLTSEKISYELIMLSELSMTVRSKVNLSMTQLQIHSFRVAAVT